MYTALFVVLCILHAVQYSTYLLQKKSHLLACLLACLLPGFASSTCGWGPANRSTNPPWGYTLARLGCHRGWIAALRGTSDV